MAETLRGMPFQYEPKRENRFVCEFPAELGIEVWKVQEFKRPSIKINKVEIPFINTSTWVSGRYTWDEQEITFLDPIGPSTSQELMEWVRLHAESLTGRMGYNQGAAKTLILKSLDPTGIEIEKWTLENCIIVSADFGSNSMSSDALQTIKLVVQCFRAILNE
jgi:hypothetical protein